MAMTPERWQLVNEIFHAALAREAQERAAFLAEACAGDPDLLAEVESLLAAHTQPGSFIDAPAYEAAAELLARATARSVAGEQFGAYRVLNQIGAGGMSDVYLADDTRLGRQVALKLLPTEFTTDPDRLRGSSAKPAPLRRSITRISSRFTRSAWSQGSTSSPPSSSQGRRCGSRWPGAGWSCSRRST